MADLLEKRGSALHIPREKGRMTMATLLSSSLDSLQYQDPPVTCKLRRKTRKAWPRWPWPRPSSSRWSSSSLPQSRAVRVVMAYLLDKSGSSLLLVEREGDYHGHILP
jgi:hypothetical protein